MKNPNRKPGAFRLMMFAVCLLATALFWGCPGPGRPTQLVGICQVSGQLAGEYCPSSSIVARKYYVDPLPGDPEPPKDVCTVHHAPDQNEPPVPPDPPAPPKPRIAVYLGALDLMGATGDWARMLQIGKENGLTGVRFIMGAYTWNGPQPGPIYTQVGTSTHENGLTFPLYRLGTPDHPSWNEATWQHAAEILAEMKRLGLRAWLVCDDFCSLKGDQRTKYFHPFYSSEEALGPDTPGGVWGDAMKPFYAALFQKVIETANASGVDYWIEPVNEFDIIEGTDDQVIAWHKWAVDTIVSLGVPRSKIVATPGRAAAAIAGQVGFYSPHGIGRPDQVKSYFGVPTSKTIFSSDGYVTGSGPADAKGRRGIGLDVADALAIRLIEVGAPAFELFDRGVWYQNNDRMDAAFYDALITRELTFKK